MIYKHITRRRISDNPNFEWVKRPNVKWAGRWNQQIIVPNYAERRRRIDEMDIRELFECAFPSDLINTLPYLLEYYEGETKAEEIINILRVDLEDIKKEYLNSKQHTFDVLKDVDTGDKITKLQHKHIIKYLKPWRTKHGGCSGVRHIDREHKDIYISARIYFWAEGIVPRTTTRRR